MRTKLKDAGPRVQTTIRLPKDTHDALAAVAAFEGVSRMLVLDRVLRKDRDVQKALKAKGEQE